MNTIKATPQDMLTGRPDLASPGRDSLPRVTRDLLRLVCWLAVAVLSNLSDSVPVTPLVETECVSADAST